MKPGKTPPSLAGLLRLLVLPLTFAMITPAQAQAAPGYAGIDHVLLSVTGLERSLSFYGDIFGGEIWRDGSAPLLYLMLGNGYLALEERRTAGAQHVAYGIDGFDAAMLREFLDMQDLSWEDAPDGLDVVDRDGNHARLVRNGSWSPAGASREDRGSRGTVFRPLALDEIFITVTNLEVDSLFYSRLLNQTGVLQAGSLWFTVGNARLRLTQAPVGQAPGLNYFSVLVSNTDMEAAAEAVFAAGGIIETILPNGFSFWDPDGHRVLVRSAGMF